MRPVSGFLVQVRLFFGNLMKKSGTGFWAFGGGVTNSKKHGGLLSSLNINTEYVGIITTIDKNIGLLIYLMRPLSFSINHYHRSSLILTPLLVTQM